ncbi:MAG: AAA family ATPase [Candidatus Limnocylindria bacterium]
MPSNPILICARDSGLTEQLETALSDAGYPTSTVRSPADAVAAMRSRPYDLIVAEGLAASGAISALRNSGSNGVVPVVVVAPANDVEARIAFLEAGADDVIVGGFAPSELEGRVMAQLIRAGSVQPASGSGRGTAELIAFFSPKGGVGTTTLAVNTAVLLAGGGVSPTRGTRAPQPASVTSRVLLIDLDLQFGQVATHLNLTPRYGIDGFAADEPALDDLELAEMYLTPHGSGIKVLAAPARPEADFRITVEHLDRMLEVLRPAFDHIVLDLGSRLDSRTVWALEQSSAHVFVLFPEIAALRAMSLLMNFLTETTPLRARNAIVVNHVFPKELLRTRDVENLLRTKPAAEVPYTEVEMIRSVNEGIPLVIGRPASPAAEAMRRIAEAVVGIEHQPLASPKKPRRGIFGRR